MSKKGMVYLTYQKDFSEKGNDRYFIYDGGSFSEVSSNQVVSLECFIVTHDFWLIASSLYRLHEALPKNIIDVVLYSKIVAGKKSAGGDVQSWDISKTVKPLYKEATDFDAYVDMYYRRKDLEPNTYMLFSHKLAEYFEVLSCLASRSGELNRFYSLELPIYYELTLASCRGIRVDNDTVRKHKESLQLDFYRKLKAFAEKHCVLYEIPSEGEVRDKLADLGYHVNDYSLKFLLDFMPSKDGYTDDLRDLQKTNKSFRIFNSISACSSRLSPVVESHWTSTSRIYHRSPNLQNISKKYRGIFIPDSGMSLCYVDYDQFEVGIMAALSKDPQMLNVFQNSDAYKSFSIKVFGDDAQRKKSKILFLSYTYGMSLQNIIRSVKEAGGDEREAHKYFKGFSVFECWREGVWGEFLKEGRIPTINGNYLNRVGEAELSDKEKRASVNHVIQGSATYIFKTALLALSKIEGVQILIPMHDAVLFQHNEKVDPSVAVSLFESVMTEELKGVVKGKASIEEFFLG
ncbi:DNA polymerase [Saccharophagus degradans]|uniref:DNA polymerase n=1 Tax=Saccharophagus degradans TaxID=86304 RepID=A0AAW7X8Z6_9GAMM|nr:DNA polymerase [Saccharophagus degradans]MDO6422968.1 DNA polymerase [Saccharophagus degradans]MDO6607113.1 DNA polymerase [Saccharophagus degradans]